MGLPKGIFNGLARVLAPLSFWMAGGWLLFPFLYLPLMELSEGTVDTAEVWLFSYIMAALCAITGILLLIYVHKYKNLKAVDMERWSRRIMKCPYCGSEISHDAISCEKCGKPIPW